MFELFFIIGTMFLIWSGALDEFRLHKGISSIVLLIIFGLSMIEDVGIKYTVYFSLAGVFVCLLAGFMFIVMEREHMVTLLYSVTLGILIWALSLLMPPLGDWYFKAIILSAIGAMLGTTFFQGSVISVLGCIVCDLFSALIAMDLELINIRLFVGDNRTAIVLAFISPIIIMALAGKRKKAMSLEGVHGAS